MSYRKLKVNNEIYQYSVGKKFTKILKDKKQIGIWENELIGNPFLGARVVGPGTIRALILGETTPIQFKCIGHNETTIEYAVDPFESEIYGRRRMIIACPKCIHNLEMDI